MITSSPVASCPLHKNKGTQIYLKRNNEKEKFREKAESKPATDMLTDWKAQYRSWSWKSEFEPGNIMTYLLLFNKFELLEVLRIQAA